jgi:hypothetical protein
MDYTPTVYDMHIPREDWDGNVCAVLSPVVSLLLPQRHRFWRRRWRFSAETPFQGLFLHIQQYIKKRVHVAMPQRDSK